MGIYGVNFLASGLLSIGTPILFFFMPETKGKDLAEIQDGFIQKKGPLEKAINQQMATK
jgi:hypothetical protein